MSEEKTTEITSEFKLCEFLTAHEREIGQSFRKRYADDIAGGRVMNFQRTRVEAIKEIAKNYNVSFTDKLL